MLSGEWVNWGKDLKAVHSPHPALQRPLPCLLSILMHTGWMDIGQLDMHFPFFGIGLVLKLASWEFFLVCFSLTCKRPEYWPFFWISISHLKNLPALAVASQGEVAKLRRLDFTLHQTHHMAFTTWPQHLPGKQRLFLVRSLVFGMKFKFVMIFE